MKRYFFHLLVIGLFLIASVSACKHEPVQGVNIESKIEIWVGETFILTPTFVPPNAYNKKVNWESSDINVAIVENGTVTGKAIGRATIKVVTVDGGKTATCYVNVIQPIEPEMVWVEGGTFMMGCSDDECEVNELPKHEVTISSFYIGRYEITQKEWVAAMGYNPSYSGASTGDEIPVHCISWDEIQVYISKLNAFTGKNYRLPTEAEWEFAARGGKKSKGYKYSGSNNVDMVAWYSSSYSRFPQPVGRKKPNELGIYDMSGNVFEFCNDSYGYYSDAPQIDPTGYGNGINEKVLRGGCWTSFAVDVRNSYRVHGLQEISWCSGGFRLVHP